MRYGLSEKQLSEITGIISEFDQIEEAVLFGSRAIGTFKEASDVDIAIKGKKVTAGLAAKLKFMFEEDTYLPFFFDFIAYPAITNEKLKEHIDKKGAVLYRKGGKLSEHDLQDYKMDTVKKMKTEENNPGNPVIMKSCSRQGKGEGGVRGWRECKLSDIADVQTGPFGSQLKNEQYITGGTPVVTVEHILNFRILDFSYPSVTDADKQRLSKYLLKTGDIVFTRVGSVDLSAWVKPTQNGWMFSSRMLRVRPNKIDSRYLSYFFQQKAFRDYILNISVGATMPSINTDILQNVQIYYPPLPEQRAISSVLSSLDDKIDLLHRQNKTLEAMAETLFRQWFVEPCKDGLPEGWREGSLFDVIELHYGKGLKTEERSGSGYPVVGSSGIVDYHSVFLVEGPGIVIGRKGTLGKVIYLWDSFYPIDTTYYIKSKVESVGLLYEYFLLKTVNFEDMNTDSAVPGLNRDIALSTEIQIPPKLIIYKFNDLAVTFTNKLKNNLDKIHILEKLRDTLLPKLMSGEVRVSV